MSVLIVLILASLAVGLTFLAAFIWSVRSGQYEDTLTPAMRVLLDDAPAQTTPNQKLALETPEPRPRGDETTWLAPVPPHPGPLPWERGNRRQSQSDPMIPAAGGSTIQGKDQGEGGRVISPPSIPLTISVNPIKMPSNKL
jgi:cbb3-type cytochrome oxidase maturation protein